MGKIVNIPSNVNFSKDWIDVGTVTDLGNNQLDISNVTTTAVKNVINEGTNSVGALCTSPNVNKWALYSPREWYASSSVLYDRPKTPYSLGFFAGYNHGASAPYSAYPEIYPNQIGQNTDTEVSVSFQLHLGEMDWKANAGIFRIGVYSEVDGNPKGTTWHDINSNMTVTHTFNLNIDSAKTVYTYPFFINSSYYRIADIPNISPIETNIGINSKAMAGSIGLSQDILYNYPDWWIDVNVIEVDQDVQDFRLRLNGLYDGYYNYVYTDLLVYASLNGGDFVLASGNYMQFTGGYVEYSAYLPFTITYGDTVNFELRQW